MADVKKGVEESLEEEMSDEFDEVFGLDEEKKKARERIKKLIEEEKKKVKEKKAPAIKETPASETSAGEELEVHELEKEQPGVKIAEPKKPEKTVKKAFASGKEAEEAYLQKAGSKQSAEATEPDAGEALDIEEVKKRRRSIEEKKQGGKMATGKNNAIAEIVEPADDPIRPELKFLRDGENTVLIGRKKSVHEKYGLEGALQVGRVVEKAFEGKDVFLDSLNPHVVFVCGARGSGKSYALGVIAEELALKNPNVGIIVIDPVGVFWSMKFPNREKKELSSLKKWGLEEKGLDNMMVFIPKGVEKDTPRETYDATFSIRPSLLTSNDWCLTFGIEKFSPTGLLLEQALEKLQKGFVTTENEKIRGKGKDYEIDDIIFCLENDTELNSREKGYKADSIRAIISRFSAAKSWGIFDSTGTPLTELSRENQLTIIDSSFLDDTVTALVIGILSRRILAARKLSTRKEAAKRMDVEKDAELLEFEIPPTWLFIDEAHTLIPSGNVKTPATEGLIEYVKQGRRPGCSLVFATQQPSAIDSHVLSQLDIIMIHKLIFNDDIKAVYKRTPAIIPHKYKAGAFIKTLPVGTALVGDRREETSRAFLMKIRPRMSQHEGREAETVEVRKKLDDSAVQRLIAGMYWNRLRRDHSFKISELERILTSMNKKYEASVPLEEVLAVLKERGAILDKASGVMMLNPVEKHEEHKKPESVEVSLMKPGERAAAGEDQPSEEEVETKIEAAHAETPGEQVSLLAFPVRISEAKATAIIKRKKLGRLFGLLRKGQRLSEMRLKHIPVFRVHFNYFNDRNAFREGILFVNSLSGEFLHYEKGSFEESRGLRELYDLKEEEILVLNLLSTPRTLKALSKKLYFDDAKILRALKKLEERDLVKRVNRKGIEFFQLGKKFDLPSTPLHPLHASIQKMPLVESEVLLKESERYSEKDVSTLLGKIWKKLVIKRIDNVYWPVFEGVIESADGKKSRVLVDAVTGKVLAH